VFCSYAHYLVTGHILYVFLTDTAILSYLANIGRTKTPVGLKKDL
jgi:hypothetical protein